MCLARLLDRVPVLRGSLLPKDSDAETILKEFSKALIGGAST
jgi:hypothetical protein